VNGFGQHSASEPFHVQILNGDQPVGIDQLAREFVLKVLALIPDVDVSPLKQPNCLPAPITTFFASRHFALSTTKLGLGLAVLSGILDFGAIGEDGKPSQSYIDSNCSGTYRLRCDGALDTKAREPAASLPLDRDRLDSAFKGSMQTYFYVSRSLDSQFVGIDQLATVAVRGKRDAVIALGGTVSRVSRFLATSHPSKECFKGFIHSTQNVLSGLRIRQCQATIGAHSGELRILGVVIERFATDFPSASALLDCSIVKRTCFFQLAIKKRRLSLGWNNAVFESEQQPSEYALGTRLFQGIYRTASTGVTA
jgi:hypothetical protein